jgi:hypothetical protein
MKWDVQGTSQRPVFNPRTEAINRWLRERPDIDVRSFLKNATPGASGETRTMRQQVIDTAKSFLPETGSGQKPLQR